MLTAATSRSWGAPHKICAGGHAGFPRANPRSPPLTPRYPLTHSRPRLQLYKPRNKLIARTRLDPSLPRSLQLRAGRSSSSSDGRPRRRLHRGLRRRQAARAPLRVSCSASGSDGTSTSTSVSLASSVNTFSAALALSSVLLASAATSPPPAAADIVGLTPCKESKAFAKREKNSLKKLSASLKKYAPDSAPALAINASIEKTKRRFENYGRFGLLCGADGLPHLIVSGDQRHWGEFITPGLLFLYIAGWIGWVGRSYLIAIRGEKKPAMREIIIDVELASRLLPRGFIWPVAAYRELVNGDLVVDDADIGYY